MKRVLSKTTGLMVALAMVISLFVPAMVMAAKGDTHKMYVYLCTGANAPYRSVADQKFFEIELTEGDADAIPLKAATFAKTYAGFQNEWGDYLVTGVDGKATVAKTQSLDGAASDDLDNVKDWKSGENLVAFLKLVEGKRVTFQYVDEKGNKIAEPKTLLVEKNKTISDMLGFREEKDNAYNIDEKGYELSKFEDGNGKVFDDWDAVKGTTIDSNLVVKKIFKKKTVDVTLYQNTNAEDTKTEVVKQQEGSKLDEKYKTGNENFKNEGFNFLGWSIDREGKTPFNLDTIIDGPMNLFAQWSSSYMVVEGQDQIIKIEDGKDLKVKANGPLSKFKELKISGVHINEDKYTKEEGSTIITIKADYLKTLKAGTYPMTFVYEDGEATTKFTIMRDDEPASDASSDTIAPTSNGSISNGSSSKGSSSKGFSSDDDSYSSNPKTGDMGISVWASLVTMSMAGVAVLVRQLKKVK